MIAPFLRKIASRLSARQFARLMSFYPPFVGAGISVQKINADYSDIFVQMKFRWYNVNYVGTQFGGSLYAMTDPFYMLMLLQNLGSGFIVWDKGAKIDFKRPGKSDVFARFILSNELLHQVKTRATQDGKYVFELPVTVMDKNGNVVCEVVKTLYVKKKEVDR